jgi:outer membrane protein assembly factor BamC
MVLVTLSGCSSVGEMLEPEKIDYKSVGKKTNAGTKLEVPPDLTQTKGDSRYAVGENSKGTATASSFNEQRKSASTQPVEGKVAPSSDAVAGMRVERAGSQRWLVSKQAPDVLWPRIKEFWQESGFLLAVETPEAGVMETDWAENRAKLPQDFIRSTLGKLLENLYSTSERDRFRTRLERTTAGGTEIYVSHRGMVEVYTRGAARDSDNSTVWQPRPADPELETEFLRRMMVKLGVTQEQAKAASAAGVAKPTARAAKVGNTPVVEIDEGFDRAWRRVGLSLDRTGFTVEDRDRAQGTYFVRYVEPSADKKEQGFFSRMFSGSEKATPPVKYRITLRSEGSSTTVSVLNASGAVETSASAQRIVQVLADDLK